MIPNIEKKVVADTISPIMKESQNTERGENCNMLSGEQGKLP